MTKVKVYILLFLIMILGVLNLSFGSNGNLSMGGYLNTALNFSYNKINTNWSINYPIYGSVHLNYEKGIMEVRCGLKYTGIVGIDELYIKGGDKKSYLKIGDFVEDWSIAKSINTLMSFSNRDTSFPNNVFFNKNYLPSPKFELLFSKNNFSYGLIISQKDKLNDINHQIVGLESSVENENSSITLGVIREIGFPPPNYFIQLRKSNESINGWMELGWTYNKKESDRWSALLGIEKNLDRNNASLELLFTQAQSIFYMNSDVSVKNDVILNLSLYLSFNDWSTGWNNSFIFLVNQNFKMRLGCMFFLGKSGKYFSPLNSLKENNDNLFLMLEFNV